MSAPYLIARALVEQRPLRVTERALVAGGDFISAEDVGSAVTDLLVAEELREDVYNVAFGRFTTIEELLGAASKVAPIRHEIVGIEEADIDRDPTKRRARYNAYAIEHIRADVGWRPRPLEEQLRTYFEWVLEDPDVRCPSLPSRR